ncbi:hypothetical protein, partial [Ileibacterium valens]
KEEGEQMSVLRELYDNRDRKLENYDRMVEKISIAEQKNNRLEHELGVARQETSMAEKKVRMIQEEKDRQIQKLLEHIRKNEPDFKLN